MCTLVGVGHQTTVFGWWDGLGLTRKCVFMDVGVCMCVEYSDTSKLSHSDL